MDTHLPAVFRLFRAALLVATALCAVALPSPASAKDTHRNNAAAPVAANMSDGLVARCFDGDTIQLTDRRIVRLAGIDSPELAHDKKKTQYYASEARQELTRLAQKKKVRLSPAGSVQKDAHGRIIADVRLENGQSLSDIMISYGAVFYYPHPDQNRSLQQRLSALQQQAIKNRRGMWAHQLSLPLARKNYTGNQESLRFFPADCPEAQRIKPRNRVHFGTLMDAFLAGYAPARVCEFWPTP
jgi:endonuclease YncB( thermonuclease family)